ncbi:MAG: copper homeostasis protein CutC [Sphingobacteriaceae bacterium]
MINLEICANGVSSALAAQEGGAIRVELCDNLGEGGTTPSYGQIALARKLLSIQLYSIIRPRGGDFLYTDLEFEVMKADIKECVKLGCDGVVIGILKADGQIDIARCVELVELAKPLGVTFHRAFDVCANPSIALEDIIKVGCERILTSGARQTAMQGMRLIAELVQQAAGRIEIMPGSGVNENNIAELVEQTGATVFHTTAKNIFKSEMRYQNPNVSFSANDLVLERTDRLKVKLILNAANTTGAS